jgi:hypothetical protein
MEDRQVTTAAVPLRKRSFSSDDALPPESLRHLQLPDSVLRPAFDGRVRTPDGPVANDCNDCDEPSE